MCSIAAELRRAFEFDSRLAALLGMALDFFTLCIALMVSLLSGRGAEASAGAKTH